MTSIHPRPYGGERENKENINMGAKATSPSNGPRESSSSARWQKHDTEEKDSICKQATPECENRAVRYAAFRETGLPRCTRAHVRKESYSFAPPPRRRNGETGQFARLEPRPRPPPSPHCKIKLLSQFRFNFSIGPQRRRRRRSQPQCIPTCDAAVNPSRA